MPRNPRRGRRGLRPAALAKMSNEQLSRAGYIRIAGFTKKDGSKVKSHIRKLSGGELAVKAMDTLSDGLVGGAKYLSDAVVGNLGKALKGDKESIGKIVDFVPVIGDVKAGKESVDAFGKGNVLEGSLLGVAGVVGVFPLVGDVAAKPFKIAAKFVNKSRNSLKNQVIQIQKARNQMKHADLGMLKNQAKELELGVLRKEALHKGTKLNPKELKTLQKTGHGDVNKAVHDKVQRETDKRIASFTKSDDFGRLKDKDLAIDAGELGSPVIKRGKTVSNTQGFDNVTVAKVATKKLGNNLSLQDVKMSLRKKYAAQGKDVDVYFHQAGSPGLTKKSFKPGAHAETGQAGTYVHMGDSSFDALKGTYGKNTHAVIVDRKAGSLIQGKRSYPGGQGEFAEAFVKPNQIVEIQDVTKNLSRSPGPKVAAKKGNVTMSQIKQARKKFEKSGSAADRKKLQALADKFRNQ